MNLYTLHNGTLTVTLDACGAVLYSIVKDGARISLAGRRQILGAAGRQPVPLRRPPD